ncbi:MAG: aminoacyl-histidine dipeptidase [Bacteroidia bacterium]
MSDQIRNLEPKAVWNNFANLSEVPRPSKKEEKVIKFIKDFGEGLGLETEVDKAGNVVIRKPATPGMENRKMVTLQSHLDMVHQKNGDVKIDFAKDPIQLRIDGQWVKATGTTLGADNGMGVATIMALLQATDTPHGPLEGLFTIDEETGMTGAFALQPGFVKGDILLNLDSEDEGELYIGCAGGVDTNVHLRFDTQELPANSSALKLRMAGLKGGHSGMDISLGLGNSNKLMARFLYSLIGKSKVQLATFAGGTARNAIPRETEAVMVCEADDLENVRKLAKEFEAILKAEYAAREPNLTFTAEKADAPYKVLSAKNHKQLVRALHACINGVYAMSAEVPGLVETSTNLSVVKLAKGTCDIYTLQRSSLDSAKLAVAGMVAAAFQLAGAVVRHLGMYPGWQPDASSEILQVMKQVYEKQTGKTPAVKAVHAGLECGIIGQKYPNMELISFGPTIRGAHSPEERAEIASVQKFWDYLLETLKEIPVKS